MKNDKLLKKGLWKTNFKVILKICFMITWLSQLSYHSYIKIFVFHEFGYMNNEVFVYNDNNSYLSTDEFHNFKLIRNSSCMLLISLCNFVKKIYIIWITTKLTFLTIWVTQNKFDWYSACVFTAYWRVTDGFVQFTKNVKKCKPNIDSCSTKLLVTKV